MYVQDWRQELATHFPASSGGTPTPELSEALATPSMRMLLGSLQPQQIPEFSRVGEPDFIHFLSGNRIPWRRERLVFLTRLFGV